MSTIHIAADSALVQRGAFSAEQTAQLLKPINPSRVIGESKYVKAHLSQQDVRAHLIRVFGFGHFDVEILDKSLIFEQGRIDPKTGNAVPGKWDVCYSAHVRLVVRNPGLVTVATYEDVSTATAENADRGAAHDLAIKSAVSLAVKRTATYLGDQFGLSLYNKGQIAALVMGTIVGGPKRDDAPADIQEGVAEQLEDGLGDGVTDDEGEQVETPAPSALPAPRKRATNGTQGTKRPAAAAKAAEAASEAPAAVAVEPAPAVVEALAVEEIPADAPEVLAPAAEAKPATPPTRPADALEGETPAEYQWRKKAEREAAAAFAADERKILEAQVVAEAERLEAEQRKVIAAEQAANLAKREADEAAEHANPATGEVAETGAEAAARIKAARATRGAATAKAAPEPWADGTNWATALMEASTVAEVKAVWDGASAAKQMTTELRMDIIKRKARVESAEAPVADDEQPPIYE